jgi:hypothetical protein
MNYMVIVLHGCTWDQDLLLQICERESNHPDGIELLDNE